MSAAGSYYTMAELEKLLGSTFFRCHRGYLVNLGKIRSYDRESIKLTNGSRRCPLSLPNDTMKGNLRKLTSKNNVDKRHAK